MPEIIKLMTQFFKTITEESFYITNPKANVIYPYLTFNYQVQPFYRSNANEVYIDFDVFGNQGNNNIEIEKVVSELIEAVEDTEKNVISSDKVFIRLEGVNVDMLPTNSDTLQRRTGTVKLRIDWREI